MKVLLLNPPGDKIYVRSYYCGSTSKANYLFQPLDLLVLSGLIAKEHEVKVMDCMVERYKENEALKKVIAEKADAIVCIVSIVSWSGDLKFLRAIKESQPQVKVIANGDVFFENPRDLLRDNTCIDAAIFDFISSDILHYLKGEEEKISNMVFRKGGEIISRREKPEGEGRVFSIPLPRHELFLNKRYRFPFVRRYPFTALITNFGCPFSCSFCIANKLFFKYRRPKEVLEELSYIASLGIKEVFFEDMSFGIPKENALELCRKMIERGMDFSWTCFSRVDLLDRKMLWLMKRAGCHTIIFGVESANEKILKDYSKDYTLKKVMDTFRTCRELKIKTVATFILGLPEETLDSCLRTIKFAKEIDCDYASFNIAVPRPGTPLRDKAIGEGLIRPGEMDFDHSGGTIRSASFHISDKRLLRLKRRANLEFYLRPNYIYRRITEVNSFTEFKEHLREFWGLVANNII